jgi:hypothetical protein
MDKMDPRPGTDAVSKGARRTPSLTHPRASVRYFGRDHCIAWHGNVQLILSTEPPTLHAMGEMAKQLDELALLCSTGTGCLLVIHSDVSPPSDEVRRFIKVKLERSSMLAAAQVVLGTGFRGAAMRSVLSLLQLAIRPRFGMRIFGDVNQGAEWLTEILQATGAKTPSAEALSRTARELGSHFFTR